MINNHTTVIIEENPDPQCLVSSCSECSRNITPDGQLNVNGMIHRQLMTKTITNIHGTTSFMNCGNCPVHIKSVSTGEFDCILAEIDGQE